MPALSAKFDPEHRVRTGLFDIRARILVSLVVSTLSIYLSDTMALSALGLATFLYLLESRRFVVVAAAYAFIALMTVLSFGLIWGFFTGCEHVVAGTAAAKTVGTFKTAMTSNLHTPFLRMIPSLNVILAISLNFSVQGFTGTMKSAHLPRALFIPLMVFCRFIPEFVEVIGQLRDAVRLRGFSLSFGSAFVHPFRTLRLTFVPLAVRTLRMADNLAIASEMKEVGYAKHPTQLNPLHFRACDGVLLVATVLLCGALGAWQVAHPAKTYQHGNSAAAAKQTEASK